MTDCNEKQIHWKYKLLSYWAEQEDLYLDISKRLGI